MTTAKQLALKDAAAKAQRSESELLNCMALENLPVYLDVTKYRFGISSMVDGIEKIHALEDTGASTVARLDPGKLAEIAKNSGAQISFVWIDRQRDVQDKMPSKLKPDASANFAPDTEEPPQPTQVRLIEKKGRKIDPLAVPANSCALHIYEQDIDKLLVKEAAREHDGKSEYFTIGQLARKIVTHPSFNSNSTGNRSKVEKDWREKIYDGLCAGELKGLTPYNLMQIEKKAPGAIFHFQRALIDRSDANEWASKNKISLDIPARVIVPTAAKLVSENPVTSQSTLEASITKIDYAKKRKTYKKTARESCKNTIIQYGDDIQDMIENGKSATQIETAIQKKAPNATLKSFANRLSELKNEGYFP